MIKKKIILQLSQWYCDCNMIHDFLLTEKKKIICWDQCQLNMFMLQDDNRQNFPINKLPVPLRLFVKSQCKTENWNKTNILQCPTCFFDVERTNQTTGVKQSLLKWSGDPRVEKTQVRNCRRTWTSALWLYLRP